MVIEILKHLLRPFIQAAKDLKSKDFLVFLRLRGKLIKKGRYKEFKIKIYSDYIFIPDSSSFLSSFKPIFVDKIYKFNPIQKKPVILDIGANIGLSTIYFSKVYKDANIIAYEADPVIFSYLKKNCSHLSNMPTLKNKAVWSEDSSLYFKSTGDDAGKIVSKKDHDTLEVESENISDILTRHDKIDMLKIDIEGAEIEVMIAASEHLRRVKSLFVEYHSICSQDQRLEELLEVLAKVGFRYFIHPELMFDHPLVNKSPEKDFDMRLNIFALNENLTN